MSSRVIGEIPHSARIALQPPSFAARSCRKGAKGRGLRYEERVHEYLWFSYPDWYVPSPWLHFRLPGEERFRWCQPDGLLIEMERGIVHIVEVKYTHTPEAWRQLRQLYTPVLRRIFPPELWRIQVCEVTRFYDCAIPFPEPVRLVKEPSNDTPEFKLHIFKP